MVAQSSTAVASNALHGDAFVEPERLVRAIHAARAARSLQHRAVRALRGLQMAALATVAQRPVFDGEFLAGSQRGLGPAAPHQHVRRAVLEGVEVVAARRLRVRHVHPHEHVRVGPFELRDGAVDGLRLRAVEHRVGVVRESRARHEQSPASASPAELFSTGCVSVTSSLTLGTQHGATVVCGSSRELPDRLGTPYAACPLKLQRLRPFWPPRGGVASSSTPHGLFPVRSARAAGGKSNGSLGTGSHSHHSGHRHPDTADPALVGTATHPRCGDGRIQRRPAGPGAGDSNT